MAPQVEFESTVAYRHGLTVRYLTNSVHCGIKRKRQEKTKELDVLDNLVTNPERFKPIISRSEERYLGGYPLV